MTVTINTPIPLTATSWLISWSSDLENPTFYIYRDGVLISTTTETSITIIVATGETPVIEVLDEAGTPATAFPGNVMLCWYPREATDYYRIDESVSAVWTERAKVYDEGQAFFIWYTRWLEDSTLHQFRIVPVGTNGNEGTATEVSQLMVRHPDPPAQNFGYSAITRKITISA